jgi:hypothetical protein
MKKLLLTMTLFIPATYSFPQNVGIGTQTPVARLHVADSSVLFTGPLTIDDTSNANPPIDGPGGRMMWYPRKLAFRVGMVTGTHWDKNYVGVLSFASGYNSVASGIASIAMGASAYAGGLLSGAWGSSCTATGHYSTAIGFSSYADGSYSMAIGNSTQASGEASTAIGSSTYAVGDGSTAIGTQTYALGHGSMTMGQYTIARGNYATATGQNTIARGNHSFITGRFNDTSAAASLFEIGYGSADNDRKNAFTVMADGNVGLGKTNPTRKLEVFLGNSGSSYHSQTSVGIEYNYTHYLSMLTNNQSEVGILFGNVTYGGADGGIIYRGVEYGINPRTMYFRIAGDTRMIIHPNSNVWIGGSLIQASDARLKKNITHLTGVLSSIQRLNGYTYYWNDENKDKEQQIGLLAQEIQKEFPQLVTQTADGSLSVNYIGLIPVLLEGLKEQQRQINELKQHYANERSR